MMPDFIDWIYNNFPPDKRDLSRVEFRKEIKALFDPVKMQRDLANIELMRARERTNRIRIDRSLRKKK